MHYDVVREKSNTRLLKVQEKKLDVLFLVNLLKIASLEKKCKYLLMSRTLKMAMFHSAVKKAVVCVESSISSVHMMRNTGNRKLCNCVIIESAKMVFGNAKHGFGNCVRCAVAIKDVRALGLLMFGIDEKIMRKLRFWENIITRI